MTEKKVYYGSTGPLLYDDTDLISDVDLDFAGLKHHAVVTDGQLIVEEAASLDNHVVRFADAKNDMNFVIPEWYGAVGDGTTDDVVAFQAAIDDLGADGGVVQLKRGSRYLIDSADLDLEEFCVIRGSWEAVDQYTGWADRGGIILNTSYSINPKASSGIKEVMILRKGLTGHEATSASFLGTAIDIASGCHGVQIEDTIILGFVKAIQSTGAGRGTFRNVKGDCTNGIFVTGSADVTRVLDCHFWPFVTNTPGAGQQKAGTGIYFYDQVDWGIISRCFTYGFTYGIRLRNVHGVTVSDCGEDYPNVAPTSGDSGILIDGSTNGQNNHITVRGNRAAGVDHGIRVDIANATDHPNITLVGNCSWECDTTHIGVYGDADISIIGNTMDGTSIGGVGVLFDGTESITGSVIGNVFKDLTTGITAASIATVRYFGNVFQNCTTGISGEGNVTAAATIDAPVGQAYIPIDGNTNIDTINLGWDGRIIVLRFSGTPTVGDMTGNVELAGAFVATNLDTLTLIWSDASNRWFEISRSNN